MGRRKEKLATVLPSFWHVVLHFASYIRHQRLVIGISIAMVLGGIVVRLLEPWPLKYIIDRLVFEQRPGAPQEIPAIASLDTPTLIAVAAIAFMVLAGVRAVTDYVSRVGFFVVGNRVVIKVRDALFRHLHRLSLRYHGKAKSGDLIVRVTRDVSLLRDVASTALLPLVVNVLVLVGILVIIFWLQWRLALVAVAIVPLFWMTSIRTSRRIRDSARKQRQREGAMAALAAESLGAIQVLQTYGLEGVFAENFSGRNRAAQKEDLKAQRLSARLGRTIDVLLAIATAVVMWYGATLVFRSQLTPGDLIVFLFYLKRAFKPAQNFAKYTARLAKATAAGERVIEVMRQTPEIKDARNAIPAPALTGAIRFAGVSFGYERKRPVLKNLDFEIAPGSTVVLAGRSGIGKSTFVSLFPRLYDPTEGSVMIDGRDIREYTLESLRSQIGIVLQDSVLFNVSIRDNIAFGLLDASDEQIQSAARLAHAHEFIEQLTEGYDTVVSERGVSLSYGQRQRIAIARAAIRPTSILILDEPVTGLDEESERAVMESLRHLMEERTTFLITHDVRLAALADEIIYLENGRITERGTYRELMDQNGHYALLNRNASFPSQPARENIPSTFSP